jgi:hypothetical protein
VDIPYQHKLSVGKTEDTVFFGFPIGFVYGCCLEGGSWALPFFSGVFQIFHCFNHWGRGHVCAQITGLNTVFIRFLGTTDSKYSGFVHRPFFSGVWFNSGRFFRFFVAWHPRKKKKQKKTALSVFPTLRA